MLLKRPQPARRQQMACSVLVPTARPSANSGDGCRSPGAQSEVTIEYGYDGNDNLLSVQADQPGGVLLP
jgi:hypothetical protein